MPMLLVWLHIGLQRLFEDLVTYMYVYTYVTHFLAEAKTGKPMSSYSGGRCITHATSE